MIYFAAAAALIAFMVYMGRRNERETIEWSHSPERVAERQRPERVAERQRREAAREPGSYEPKRY